MSEKLDERSLWSITYGLYVVTSAHEGKANGQMANTVVQVTAEPPRLAVTINKGNYTHELISASGRIGVSVLGSSTPLDFIGGFGFRSGRDIDKLAGVASREGVTGVPLVLENAVSVFEGRIIESVDMGTHTVFFFEVEAGEVLSNEAPLTYAEYHARKGKAPKAAPTYRKPELEK